MKHILFLALLTIPTASSVSAREFEWSGLTWQVREGKGGPGPNSWSPENVWVDKQGWLHLAIKKTSSGWQCAEVTSKSRLGFGKYSFEVEGDISAIDKNLVLGMFMYPPPDVGEDGTNEIDIEFAKWGHDEADYINYTVWNRDKKGNRNKSFKVNSNLRKGTFSFDWSADHVDYESSVDSLKWGVTSNVAAKPQTLAINFWLFKGLEPSNGQPAEFVIKSIIIAKSERTHF